VTTNMPLAGPAPIALDTDALEALRDQADGLSNLGRACSDKRDVCYDANEGEPFCIFRADDSEFPCPGGIDFAIGNTLWCARLNGESLESCELPAGGGVNPMNTSLTPEQLLTKHYPTIIVYPYYDSGKTYPVNGVQRKSLVPMASFGMHVIHHGTFYGWLQELVGTGIENVGPNFYRIPAIANEGKKTIRVTLSAEEQPHFAPFSQIYGSASTPLIGNGKVILSGVVRTSQAINLGKTKIRFDKMLADGGTELVSNLGAPVTLTALAGGTTTAASYAKTGTPTITAQILNLPLIGLVTNIQTINAKMKRPAACAWWFGSTMLTTDFTLDDAKNPKIVARGTDQWSCLPVDLINL
jgi:hypothetical protein